LFYESGNSGYEGTMKRVFSRFLGRFGAKLPAGSDFSTLQDIYPIGNKRGGLIINKAGRGVLRARWAGQDVKLYEAASPQHARFISAVSSKVPDLFPKVIQLRESWVMAEWVQGKPLTHAKEERQAEVLRRIHALPLDGLPPPGFCYLRDFIIPRYMRAAALGGQEADFDDIIAQVECSSDKRVLMHPDVSFDNLLQMEDGRVVCVDNELLCTGHVPLLDLCNAMRPLSQEQRETLAELWFLDSVPSSKLIKRTAKAWIVREAGSAFISGQMPRCSELLGAMNKEPEEYLPFFLAKNNTAREEESGCV
jgi:hypothetical protein